MTLLLFLFLLLLVEETVWGDHCLADGDSHLQSPSSTRKLFWGLLILPKSVTLPSEESAAGQNPSLQEQEMCS